MEYRNFGTGGVKVSPIALGLGFRGQADPAAAERTIRAAIENGINLIDCANVYGLTDSREFAGTSEKVLSKVLKDHRDDLVVTSKVFSPIGPGPNDSGLSRFHIMREIERTLRRLDTDHIDVYLVHGYDDVVALEEQFRALDDLVTQGKTRYIGVCNYQAWQVVQAVGIQDQIGAGRLITVQNPYSLLNRALEYEMFPMLSNTGIGAMAYSPLAVGLLSGAYVPEEIPPDHTLWGSIRRELVSGGLAGKSRRGALRGKRSSERTLVDHAAGSVRVGPVSSRSHGCHFGRRYGVPDRGRSASCRCHTFLRGNRHTQRRVVRAGNSTGPRLIDLYC